MPVAGENGTMMRSERPICRVGLLRRSSAGEGRAGRQQGSGCDEAAPRNRHGGVSRVVVLAVDSGAARGRRGRVRRCACTPENLLELVPADDVLDPRERPVAAALVHDADDRVGRVGPIGQHDLGRRGEALRLVVAQGRRPARRRARAGRVRQRASRIACPAPFEPRGTIGCAASPSSVTRPCVHQGSGSWSTIGNSSTESAARISAGTSSQSKCQSAKAPMKSASWPGRFQSRWR